MTTLINFAPTALENFQFIATFDGKQYNVIVTWNLFGQRYYINVYTLQNALILCMPLIGSPQGYDISLTKGYFETSLVYRAQNRQFEIAS